jgi:hypothetical protein
MLKEINASHHQKKKLIKAIHDDSVMFVEDNGDIIINAKTYPDFVANTEHDPLKTIMGIDALEDDLEYLVIQ